jgi:hypothetical protein
MNKFFKIKLNSDCILKSISANEGVPESLSFIPGSLILGIIAQKYNDFSNPFDLFHSGKVKFGNALIFIDGKPSLKAPLSWHYPKDEEKSKKIVGAHIVNGYDELEKLLSDKQPKQIREDYIDVEFKSIYTPDYNFQLKSAFDSKSGRSLDASMFAYETLKEGTEYIFEIFFDSSIADSDIKAVEEILIGRHFIGKSKTAQFGNIDVVPYNLTIADKSFNSISDFVFSAFGDTKDKDLALSDEQIFLYAKSDIILNNEYGFNIVNLESPAVLGINTGKILHKKTYVDYRKFNMFNSAVKRRMPIRTAIIAGSVICIEGIDKAERDFLISKRVIYAGNYISEGFGEIYVNPPFLFKKEYNGLNKYTDACLNESKNKSVQIYDDKISQEINIQESKVLKYLNFKISEKYNIDKSLELAESIHNNNKNKFSKITRSQWGTIRNIAKRYGNDKKALIEKISEYTGHGVAYDIWESTGAREILIKTLKDYKDDTSYNFTVIVEYLAKLCSSDVKKI